MSMVLGNVKMLLIETNKSVLPFNQCKQNKEINISSELQANILHENEKGQ